MDVHAQDGVDWVAHLVGDTRVDQLKESLLAKTQVELNADGDIVNFEHFEFLSDTGHPADVD